MRLALFCFVALTVLLLSSKAALSQSLDEVLAEVSANVQDFRTSLPDFLCSEHVTSAMLDRNGRPDKQVNVDSVFSVRQRRSGDSGPTFVETREVKSINGKPVKARKPFPNLPFRYGGGFSSALLLTFLPANIDAHIYKLSGKDQLAGDPALLIDFSTKEDQQRLRLFLKNTTVLAKDDGRAWIQERTMQVLRLVRRQLNMPGFRSYGVTVDYAETSIGGARVWLPRTVVADGEETRTGLPGRYTAEYKECRKFSSSVEIN